MASVTVREMLTDLVKGISDIKTIMVITTDHNDEISTGFSDVESNVKAIGVLEVGKELIKSRLWESGE